MMGLISIKISSFYNKNIWDIQEKHLVFTSLTFALPVNYLLIIINNYTNIVVVYGEMCEEDCNFIVVKLFYI